MNLTKLNYNLKYISTKKNPNGTEIVEPVEIINEQKVFYTNLYKSKIDVNNNPNTENKYLKNVNIPELDAINKSICKSKLTLEDLYKSVLSMANEKTPEPDGFTSNFYKKFWMDLQIPLYDSYIYSFVERQLSDNQRRGFFSLIPKAGKALRYLKSWRPVSLLVTDYKILAKVLNYNNNNKLDN